MGPGRFVLVGLLNLHQRRNSSSFAPTQDDPGKLYI
jgi:hypothetical protein